MSTPDITMPPVSRSQEPSIIGRRWVSHLSAPWKYIAALFGQMTGRNLVFISFPLHLIASKISSSTLYEEVFSWTFKTYIEQKDYFCLESFF